MQNSQIFNTATWQHPWQALDEKVPLWQETDIPSQDFESIAYLSGTLKADRFKIETTARLIVISGNGNVNYGQGEYDLLDLSDISINYVKQLKEGTIDGVLFNPGNGARLFDAIFLKDGRQILFEGLDIIQFSDTTLYFSIFPNDPEFDHQWNLHMMGVHNAWRFTQGNPSILIGIQDTGLAYKNDAQTMHPDLGPTVSVSNTIKNDF
jgi:serine protease